jgi:predicted porin
MRNTKIALAVLALVASTAAMAEGVTISGVIDAGIANTTSTDAAGTTKVGTYFSGAGGFVAGNNINFSGSEELEGGMKASFTLGAGFDAGNGSSGNGGSSAMFTQQANVGLAGDFGSVKLGMQLSPFIASVAGTGMLGNGHFFVNRLLSIGGGSDGNLTNAGSAGPGATSGGFFIPNAVSYSTPAIGGFTATALTTTKSGSEGSVSQTPANTNAYNAFSLTGAMGDVGVSATYHKRADVYSAWATSANYKMGQLTIAGNYMSSAYDVGGIADNAGVTVKSWGLGAGYDVSDKATVGIQYAKNDITGGNQALTGVHAKYSLSKRTSAYVSYTNATNGAASAYEGRAYASNVLGAGGANPATSNRTMVVGVAHSF